MRQLRREPLSPHAEAVLCERTLKIAEAANAKQKRAERPRTMRVEVEKQWKNNQTSAFDEIRQKLMDMAPGNQRCMYCEDNEGTDIEHFWPKKKYPWRAFSWDNYLWACSACNSNHKRDRFEAQRTLCRHPHASVFATLLRVVETPAAARFIQEPCLEALTAHPEVKEWIG